MKRIFIGIIITLVMSPFGVFGAEVIAEIAEDNEPEPVVLRLRVEKNDEFLYDVRADFTSEIRASSGKNGLIRKTEDNLKILILLKCVSIQNDGLMHFEMSYQDYSLARKITDAEGIITEEVYLPEGLKIFDSKGLIISKKWDELPRSEQTEIRKTFARNHRFSINENNEIFETEAVDPFEREIPDFHIVRLQQSVYYPDFPIQEGTVWSWKKAVSFPEIRDNPLSKRKIDTMREYELISTGEVAGIPSNTVSFKEQSALEDVQARLDFTRRVSGKVHAESETGMAVNVEGAVESNLTSGGLKGTERITSGKYTITRVRRKESEKGK